MNSPITHLSWSKISSFDNYRSQFIKTYFEKQPFFETKEIVYWKVLGAVLETESFDFDIIMENISKDRNWNPQPLESRVQRLAEISFEKISGDEEFCEKLMNFQFELAPIYEQSLKQTVNDVYCTGYIDNCPDITEWPLEYFREFKTGKKPWTQERADQHGQIYFYAMLLEEQTGVMPSRAYLDWIVTTDDEEGNIIGTWEIKTFEVKIDPKKVKKLREKLPKYIEEMNECYEKWLESQEWQMELSTDVFEKYAELDKQKKAIDEEQKELKKEIDAQMQKSKVNNFKLEWGWTFFYKKWKKWDYSDDIKNKESEVQEEMKDKLKSIEEMKSEFEEKNDPKITLSLSFRWWK